MATTLNKQTNNLLRKMRATVMATVILLTLAPVMTFAQDPANTTVTEGGTATFSYTAMYIVGSTFTWQVSTDNGANWAPVSNGGNYSGATTATLTISNVPLSFDGYQYRVRVNIGAFTNPATLTVTPGSPLPVITPSNPSVPAGGNITLSIPTGAPRTFYQWQVNGQDIPVGGNYSGATTNELTISNVPGGFDGNEYRIGTRTSGLLPFIYSNPVTLTVTGGGGGSLPVISEHPKNQSVPEGQTATFSISATGADTYQWQGYTGSMWRNFRDGTGGIAGSQTATLNINNVTLAINGQEVRCIVSNSAGDVTSNTATLTVTTVTSPIIASPESATTTVGGTAYFSVKIDNIQGVVAFQWRVSKNKGSTWENVENTIRLRAYSGADTYSLTISDVTPDMDGYQYHCVVTTQGGVFTSAPATLTVNAPTYTPPEITSQPVSQTMMEGGSATFTVGASGSALQYQWQHYYPYDNSWNNIEENWDEYSGAQTASLTINLVTEGYNGNQFRCRVIAGNLVDYPVYSNAVTLTVPESSLVITDPVDRTVTEGGSTTFSVGVSYDGQFTLYYQWWYMIAYNCGSEDCYVSGYVADDDGYHNGICSGANTATLSLSNIPNYLDGAQYYCQITKCESCGDGYGMHWSESATLHVDVLHSSITQHPSDKTILEGTGTTFSVTAVKGNTMTSCLLTYQWWVYDNCGDCDPKPVENGGVYSGAQTATLTLSNVPLSFSGYEYFCQVSDMCEWQDASYSATLTVTDEPMDMPAILMHPDDISITQGGNASFDVTTAHPDKFSYMYQWQYRPNENADFIDVPNTGIYSNARTSSLTLSNVPTSYNDYQYRCRVIAPEWNNWMDYSYSAILTVNRVDIPPTITTLSVPAASQGRSYSVTLTATGTTPITWSITAGSLPNGLSLDVNTGRISGTPTTTGQLSLTVRATNSVGYDTKAFTFVVNEPSQDPPVIEITEPSPSEPFCTANDYLSVPFRRLDNEHPMKYSLRFSDDAKTAGFRDTPLADLPADMSFKIDVPKGAPSRSYSAVIVISCEGIGAYQDEYPFTFSVSNNGVVIVNQPPAFQSLCGSASIAMAVDIEGDASSYQWYINGQAIAGARSNEYIAARAGNYYVEIMGSCGVLRSAEAVVYSPASDPASVNILTKWGNVMYVANASDKYISYQWYHDGTAIQGATDVYLSVKEGFLGSYSVQCFKQDGSYDETCPVVFDVNTKSSYAAVYPTVLRSNDVLNINITDAGINVDATIEIYSLLGVQVYSTRINTPVATIRPDFRQKGNYFVKIKLSSGEVLTEKIIIQ